MIKKKKNLCELQETKQKLRLFANQWVQLFVREPKAKVSFCQALRSQQLVHPLMSSQLPSPVLYNVLFFFTPMIDPCGPPTNHSHTRHLDKELRSGELLHLVFPSSAHSSLGSQPQAGWNMTVTRSTPQAMKHTLLTTSPGRCPWQLVPQLQWCM